MRKKHTQKGFTLIELMVVMGVLSLVATLGIGGYINAQKRARDARRLKDLQTAANAQEQFFSANNSYALIGGSPCNFVPLAMATTPRDPLSNTSFRYECSQPAGANAGRAFCIRANLEVTRDTSANCTGCNCTAAGGTDCVFTTAATNTHFCVKNLQ